MCVYLSNRLKTLSFKGLFDYGKTVGVNIIKMCNRSYCEWSISEYQMFNLAIKRTFICSIEQVHSYYCNTVCTYKLMVADGYECNNNVNKRLKQHSCECSSLLQGLNSTTMAEQVA